MRQSMVTMRYFRKCRLLLRAHHCPTLILKYHLGGHESCHHEGDSRRVAQRLHLRDVCRARTAKRACLQDGHVQFCYYGLPHPKATPEQLATEKMGAYKTYKQAM